MKMDGGKKDTIKIFVGNLRENSNENKLRATFEQFGTVTECAVLNKYGFVHMTNEDEANAAIAALNNSEFEGIHLRVERSSRGRSNGAGHKWGGGGASNDNAEPTTKIFVGNLHYEASVEDLRKKFEEHGKVVECDILSKFGFVHMADHDEATSAIQALNGELLNGRRMQVALSKDDPSMKPPVKIFVGNLRDGADKDALREKFEKFGKVTECAVLNKFGFVHMANEKQAHSAISALHRSEFEGSRINVELSRGDTRSGGDDRYDRDRYYDEDDGYRDSRSRGRRDTRGSRYDPYARRPPPYDPYARRSPPRRDPYADAYYSRDSYRRYPKDPYDRYPPPTRDPYDRYPPPARDPYDRYPPPPADRDPYARYDRDPYVRYPPLASKDVYSAYAAPSAPGKDRYATAYPSLSSAQIDPYAQQQQIAKLY